MKILLINSAPSGTLKATGVLFPPLGLLYVAAYAEREGHQVVVRDLAVQKKNEDLVFKDYDVVGISTDTTRHRQALQMVVTWWAFAVLRALAGFLLLGPFELWNVHRGYRAWSHLALGENDFASDPWRKSWWWIPLSFVALFRGVAAYVITTFIK